MRGAPRACSLACVLLLASGGQPARVHAGGGSAGESDGAPAAAPRLSVDPQSFDFGRTLPRRVLRQEFRLRNFGERELTISDLRTDCGCTAALLDARDRKLAPGAAATLEVTLQTGNAAGPVVRRVMIVSDDPEHKIVELLLKADVQPEPESKPKSDPKSDPKSEPTPKPNSTGPNPSQQ